MSAGKTGEYPGEPPITIESDLDCLAPLFRDAVIAGLAECRAQGLDAVVHESCRSRATAEVYYARGRTTIPPHGTVTNARDETWSWHGYGLAVDVISESKGWGAGSIWFGLMGAIFEKHGCKWGGRWAHPDFPHVQWGKCKDTPSDRAREVLAANGMDAVWTAVGANTTYGDLTP
jgi:hypothetical protein